MVDLFYCFKFILAVIILCFGFCSVFTVTSIGEYFYSKVDFYNSKKELLDLKIKKKRGY